MTTARFPGRPGWLPGDPQPAARPAPAPYRAEPIGVTLDPLRADLDEQLWRRRIVRVSGRLDLPAAETALARVLLAEQLYRAWSILQNHPYHRA
jgi:23S rRNA (pseudouridine1915-N3)-methyltransferase